MSESPFVHRGIVEGYYGRPYTHADRAWLLDRMAAWEMNTYVYAPKDDPLHRDRWREPYPDETLDEFEGLVAHGAALGIRVGFAVAPGLSIEYGSESDRLALASKLDAFAALGARFFCLALDDVPSELEHESDRAVFASLAAAHVDVANALRCALPDDATLWLVPTDYAGTADSSYLQTLGAGLDEAIEVGWTGRSVVSPEIRAAEARVRAATLGRRLLVWDNYPVNDGPMRNVLHLAPYLGRDADLAHHVSGILLNPMELPRASAVGLATAGAYMANPGDYDAEAAWRAATRQLGAGAPDAFARFAAGHRFSALTPADRDAAVENAWHTLRDALEAGRMSEAAAALPSLTTLLESRAAAADGIRESLEDRALLEEIEPWLTAHTTEARVMREATDVLAVLIEEAPAMRIALAFFRMEGRLTRIPPVGKTSFGPRRHVYPQLESLEDHGARFSNDPVLFVDQCLSDEIVRFAEAAATSRLGGRVAETARR